MSQLNATPPISTRLRRIQKPFECLVTDLGAKFASLLLLVLATALACSSSAPNEEELKAEVESALDTLAAELAVERPAEATEYPDRLRAYLDAHPAFYGSAAALLDSDGTITASPYVYRTSDDFATLDLAVPSYNIDSQVWVTAPLAANEGVWTDPYFDAGGGEIWMITRSVPVRDADGIFAIVTTDLPVEAPSR